MQLPQGSAIAQPDVGHGDLEKVGPREVGYVGHHAGKGGGDGAVLEVERHVGLLLIKEIDEL